VREHVRPAREDPRSPACLPSLHVAKFGTCPSCANPRCDGARPYYCKEHAPRERRSAVVDSRREENRRIFSADAADLEPVHRHYAPPIPVKAGSASSSYWAVIAPTAPTCSPIAFRPLPDGLRRSAPLGALCAPINWSYGSRSTS
jgi:hypothetical protein